MINRYLKKNRGTFHNPDMTKFGYNDRILSGPSELVISEFDSVYICIYDFVVNIAYGRKESRRWITRFSSFRYVLHGRVKRGTWWIWAMFAVARSIERRSPCPICKLTEIRFSGTVLFDGVERDKPSRRVARDDDYRPLSPCRSRRRSGDTAER